MQNSAFLMNGYVKLKCMNTTNIVLEGRMSGSSEF